MGKYKSKNFHCTFFQVNHVFVFCAQMAQEGPSPHQRRSLRRCLKARRAKTDRRASRLLISKETRHDNLRGWRMGQETWGGHLWERRWLTARCVCLSGLSRDGERFSPRRTRGPRASQLFGAQQQKSEIWVTRNLVMNRCERGCVCVRAKQTLWTPSIKETLADCRPHFAIFVWFISNWRHEPDSLSPHMYCITSLGFLQFFLFPLWTVMCVTLQWRWWEGNSVAVTLPPERMLSGTSAV